MLHTDEAGPPRFAGDPSRGFATFSDPGRSGPPRQWRRSRCCPADTNTKAPALFISRLSRSLRHPLCTLHDAHCRTPCNTRFRLAGCAFAGRESNPLDHDERFQVILSSFPGLGLAQRISNLLQSDARKYSYSSATLWAGWSETHIRPNQPFLATSRLR